MQCMDEFSPVKVPLNIFLGLPIAIHNVYVQKKMRNNYIYGHRFFVLCVHTRELEGTWKYPTHSWPYEGLSDIFHKTAP